MEVPIRILVVDDEPDIRNVLRLLLTSRGYSVEEAANGREALEQVQKNAYDLIILDIMMPEMNGVDACAALREISSAPVLFLTAKDQDADKQEAFHSGGDDYLVKPFSNQELFLRVEALVRRYRVYKGKGEAPTLISSLEVNRERGTVAKHGEPVDVTKTEFELLMFLIENRGAPVSTRSLYENVWKEKYLPSSANTVMVHILKLRKKLEDDPGNPKLIRTIWGKGYQID
jgi:DNA-binding response OmpR family regulator